MNESDFDMIDLDTSSIAKQSHTVGASTVYDKYGEASVAGFQPVPDLLLKNQKKLGLSVTDLVVLLNVLMHWWYPEQYAFTKADEQPRPPPAM